MRSRKEAQEMLKKKAARRLKRKRFLNKLKKRMRRIGLKKIERKINSFKYRSMASPIRPAPPTRLSRSMRRKKIGRNKECVCGSTKKYKKCCLAKLQEPKKEENKDQAKE